MSSEVAKIDNTFGGAPAERQGGPIDTVTNSDQARAIQEVQAAMIVAKRFPRDPRAAVDRILNACTRPKLAETALYSYPRGGQEVTGPSIRLAEALAQNWGNMQFGIRELSQADGESTVEAFAWDVETNTRQTKVFRVPHIRYTRQGSTRLTDPRDIYEMIANQGARRLRACILGVIPGDVVEDAVNQCELTQQTNVDVSPETIKKMVEFFGQWGVTQEMIEKRIGKRVEAINAAQVLSLKKIVQSLKDGMSKPSAWFDIDAGDEVSGPKSSDLTEELKPDAKAGKAEKAKRPAKDPAVPTYAEVAEAINGAESLEALQKVWNTTGAAFRAAVDDEQQVAELTDLHRQRLDQLQAIEDEREINK